MSRPLPHLALVPLLASLTVAGACARDPLAAAPRATAAAAASEPAYQERVRRRLEGAAAGLLYMSESDYPFTYYFRPARIDGELRLAEFRALEGISDAEPVEQITLDAFFARHIENVDPFDAVAVGRVPEYEHLKRTLEQELDRPRVFRVGTIAVHCYVVGTDRDGNVVGLTTTAIET